MAGRFIVAGGFGAPLTPAPFAGVLEQAYLVNADQIAAAARKAMATN